MKHRYSHRRPFTSSPLPRLLHGRHGEAGQLVGKLDTVRLQLSKRRQPRRLILGAERQAARCAIAYLSPPAAAPSVTPPLQADDQAASSPLRFSPSARVFSSPADPLCRTIELGQLAEMQKSPALSVEQLCSSAEEENERAIADELVVLAAMDPESLAFSDGTNAGHILPLHS